MCSLLLLLLVVLSVQELQAEIFDTSTDNQYENTSITCIQQDCEIICDTISGCAGSTIDASSSNTLSISCLGNNSCANMNIISGASILTEIRCEYFQSCAFATINVQNSQSVNLTCEYDGATADAQGACSEAILSADNATNVDVNCIGDYSCYKIRINTANVATALNLNCNGYMNCHRGIVYCPLNNECNIKCSSDSFACSFMDIYIDNVDSNFNISCPGSSAYDCVNTDIHCGGTADTSFSTLLHDSKSAWGCHVEGCCPTYFFGATISCEVQQCNIDCVNNDCSTYVIDGLSASSLTVSCNQTSGGGCGVTNIICPTNPSAPCTVNCQGDKSCYQSFVKATDAYSLELDCQGDESCKRMVVKCPFDANNTNGGCTINCNGDSACYYGEITATGSNSLNLDCKQARACFALNPIYCPFHEENVCNIDCSSNDEHICFGMIFYANWGIAGDFAAGYLDLQCPNTNSNDACGNQLLLCNYGSMHIRFDEVKSIYTCVIEPGEENTCCPWDDVPNTRTPTETPTGTPTTETVTPTTRTPTTETVTPTTRTPTTETVTPTNSPSMNPSAITKNPSTSPTPDDVDPDPVGNSVCSKLSIIRYVFCFCIVFLLFT